MNLELLDSDEDHVAVAPISPLLELGAYETLWLQKGATFKRIAERFAKDPTAFPSHFVPPKLAISAAREVLDKLDASGVLQFGVRIHHAGDYPLRLRDAKHPIELLYYRGAWELTNTKSVAVVGTRRPSSDGEARAKRLARELVKRDYTVVSGLARGIDSAAHVAAIDAGGQTIAVVGTPLGSVYPKENEELQEQIASRFLLVSPVPVLRYAQQDYRQNRSFFPERNKLMSALTMATVIVEAGETSGTLTQARAALDQGRLLFILDSCFKRQDITWPARFVEEGAVRVKSTSDMWEHLERPSPLPQYR